MRLAKVGEICSLVTDGTHYSPQDVEVGVPFVTVKDLGRLGLDLAGCSRITQEAYEDARRNNCAPLPGDILFSKDGTVGKVHVVSTEGPFAVLSSLAILRPGAEVLSAYLGHMLRTKAALGQAERKKSGSAVRRIILSDLKQVEIPVPPLTEQRRIAAILDKADAIRAKRRQVLAHLDALTQSIFHQMFSQTPASVTVADVALDTRTGPFGSQLLHSEFVGEGIAVLGLDNVVDNEFRHGGGRFITSSKYEKLKRYTVIPGDVLISIMGTIGRCVVVPSDIPTAINTKHICAVTPNPELVLSQFLRASFLWHPTARAHLRRQTKGSIMDGLNMGIIRSMPIPLPSLEEQAIFAARIGSVRDAASGVLQAIGLSQQLLASLQSRAFKGEL